jgi:hypothetical protein
VKEKKQRKKATEMIKRVYKGKNAREGSACAYKCLTYILGFAYAWAL